MATLRAALLVKRGHANRHNAAYSAADADYQAAERLIPNDPLLTFNRGLLAALQGDEATAANLCRAAYDAGSRELRARMRDELANDVRLATLRDLLQD